MSFSLIELKITESPTMTLCVVTSTLTALPKLKHLCIEGSEITGNMDETSLPPRIPLFEGSNPLTLYSNLDQHDPPRTLDLILPSALVDHLDIDTAHFCTKPCL
jgi:hypothetical protein